MPDRFEILHKDLAGRIGRLFTPHGTIETPALMPVVNPHLPLILPGELKKMGADIVITNSYIIHQDPDQRRQAITSTGDIDLLAFRADHDRLRRLPALRLRTYRRSPLAILIFQFP